MSSTGAPGAEPKDGDFVAYLAEIEQRQIRAMAQSSTHVAQDQHAQPEHRPLNKAQAEVLVETLKQQAGGASANQFVGGAIIAFVGLVFFLAGLTSGEIVPIMIGGGLLWLAWTRVRRIFSGSAPRDLAERLKQQRRT